MEVEISSNCSAIKYYHNEANGRILFHINHAIQVESYTEIVIAATDGYICGFHSGIIVSSGFLKIFKRYGCYIDRLS